MAIERSLTELESGIILEAVVKNDHVMLRTLPFSDYLIEPSYT
jgi:hypothetical protein